MGCKMTAAVIRFPVPSDDVVNGLSGLAAMIEAGEIEAKAAVVVTLTAGGGVGVSVFGESSVPAVIGAIQIASMAVLDGSVED